ncbi:MAG: DoxX family protein [Bacteroidetes bacterium]|nr:DoxX family protein [Bacteroidota bacterium]
MTGTEDASEPKAKKIAYWILTGYLAFESVLSATWDFDWLNKGYATGIMNQIGFPSYFLIIKGIATLIAAPIFLWPGLRLLKEWAYFGTFLMYAGAIASHLFVHDGVGKLIGPFVFLCITVASWALRPPSRKFSFK